MTAEYNSTDKRVELLGDGTGWQRMKTIALETPPAGTNQMILFFKAWHTLRAADWGETKTYSPASYVGLSFTGNHINTTDATDPEYGNLFGFAACDTASPFTSVRIDYSAEHSSLGVGVSDGAYALSAYDTIDSDLGSSPEDYPFELSNGETNGLEQTFCWRIYTDLIDDTVRYQCWVNEQSINLETFDFSTVSPDSPTTQFPVGSNKTRSGIIHGNITGTNWRPSTGVMAFPTHFIARWGGEITGMGIYIKDPVVHYSTLTT